MLLIILIIGHLLADFFFQPTILAERKKEKIKFLFFHSAIYLCIYMLLGFLFITPRYAVITILIFSLTYLAIDFIRIRIEKKIKNRNKLLVSFIMDQVIHISVIVASYYLLKLNRYENCLYRSCTAVPAFDKCILMIFLFIVLLTPTSVFIKKLFSTVFKQDAGKDDANPNVGAWIGNLERIITAILILNGQYAAIGLVLTAKSIARFKQLEEKDFAEKYLVGTLTSLTISLIFSSIIKAYI